MSEQQRSLSFGSVRIGYSLSWANRKTLGIRVHPDCSVHVMAPAGSAMDKVEAAVRKKAPWILRQQREFLSYQPITPPRKYINGETHLYLGRQYRLKVQKGKRNEVHLRGGRITMTIRGRVSPATVLADWYRARAVLLFPEIMRSLLTRFRRYDIHEPALHIMRMRTRWGSCTANGKIILNPELMKAPRACIEYVIAHELCHLVHYNHTRAFYALQDKVMPDWRKWKERLERVLA